ncbi:MAG: hypothetical protein NW237_12090 [Cyanobacteriota bacterium]|nr:hypothetical protein [Cyanobacteriota bacterium]
MSAHLHTMLASGFSGTVGRVFLLICVLSACGNPNVPLTQPPQDAFRVTSPRPRRVDNTPTSRSTPPKDAEQDALARLTAQFLGIDWPRQAARTTASGSLVELTASFLQIRWPSPAAPKRPAALNPETRPQQATPRQQLEQPNP